MVNPDELKGAMVHSLWREVEKWQLLLGSLVSAQIALDAAAAEAVRRDLSAKDRRLARQARADAERRLGAAFERARNALEGAAHG